MSEHAFTGVTTHDDGKFVRTAIVLEVGAGGSIDIVNPVGERIALVNFFTNEDNTWFAVDVIDKEDRFHTHAAIAFEEGNMRRLDDCNGLVAADFRMREDS